MKKYFLLLIGLIPILSFPKGTWKVQNPLPTESYLLTVEPVTDKIIFAGGMGGTLLKTLDAGETWEVKKIRDLNNIRSIYFIDSLKGWIMDSERLYKTVNGGNNWQNIEIDINLSLFNFLRMAGYNKCIYLFLQPRTAKVWELPNAKSVVLKSTDEGKTWKNLDIDIKGKMLCAYSLNEYCGFFYTEEMISVDKSINSFYRTKNGGKTWIKKRFPEQFWTSAIYFISEKIGFVGHYRTTDSGETWENVFIDNLSLNEGINDYHFIDSMNGWAISNMTIFQTMNGGKSWQKLDIIANKQFIDINFSENGEGWIVGWAGDILQKKTENNIWQSKSKGPRNDLKDVCFVNEREGWCVGWDGIILHTQNGGNIWEKQSSHTNNNLWCVKFLNNQIGCIVGDSVVMQTKNAGFTWTNNDFLKKRFVDIDFFDENYGLLIEQNGNVFRTTNGGIDWQVVTGSPFSGRLTSLSIIDENEAWIGGWQGLAHTVNKGETIYWYDVPTLSLVQDIQFVNKMEGCLITDMGSILNTNNGGWDWVKFPRETGLEHGLITVFFMLDSERSWFFSGIASGYLKTARLNGVWTSVTEEDYSATTIKSICFVNQNLGWAVGVGGTILKYETKKTIPAPVNELDRIKIFPNPFDHTGIRIIFKLENSQNVTARIFNLLGQKINDLFSGYVNNGTKELSWAPGNISSGIYFITIQCNEFNKTKKCVYIND